MTSFTGTMFDMGATPALEQAMRFAETRHRLILSNIANADTVGYRRQDLDSTRFQQVLGRALDERDRHHPGTFIMREEVLAARYHRGGFRPWTNLPYPGTDGPLRHDENNVSLEREMAHLAMNAGRYTTYAGLLDKIFTQIRSAISERPDQA